MTLKILNKSKSALKEYTKKSGKAFKDSKIYKADTNKIKPPKDYGKRQSKNIIDLRDSNSKAYKAANAHGKLQEKVMTGTSVTESKSLKKISSDATTKNVNLHANGMRSKYPDLVYKRMINPVLDLKPQRLKKK